MKKTLGLALSTAALFLMVACNNTPKTEEAATTQNTQTNNTKAASFSSAMGTLLATDFQNMGIASQINTTDFRKGFESVLANAPAMELNAAAQIASPILNAAGQQQALPTIPQEFSLALGVVISTQLSQGIPSHLLDVNTLFPVIENTLKGTNAMTRQEAEQTFQTVMMAEQQAQQPQLEAAGKAFLAENATKPNIKTTDSGLQYEVIKEGKGKKPTLANKVTVHYHGTLIDGTVFDSSVERGETISFALAQVIKGWQEGLQLMSEGAKYRLYIPHEIAYGPGGQGGIPPFSTLIFDVELFKVE